MIADIDEVVVVDTDEAIVADNDVEVSADDSTQYPLLQSYGKRKGRFQDISSVEAFHECSEASQYCGPTAAILYKQVSSQLFG